MGAPLGWFSNRTTTFTQTVRNRLVFVAKDKLAAQSPFNTEASQYLLLHCDIPFLPNMEQSRIVHVTSQMRPSTSGDSSKQQGPVPRTDLIDWFNEYYDQGVATEVDDIKLRILLLELFI